MLDPVAASALVLLLCAALVVALRRSSADPGELLATQPAVTPRAAERESDGERRRAGSAPMSRADVRTQRRNRALEADVRAGLAELRSMHLMARYEVAVSGSRATLVGHVRSRPVGRGMVEAAGRVRGISSVDETLVADDELERQVASAIGRGELNRWSRLVVSAELGHVRIGGHYPSAEARTEALRVGAGVPGVAATTAGWATELLV